MQLQKRVTNLEAGLLARLTNLSPAHELPASGKVASIMVEHIQALGPYLGRFLPIQPAACYPADPAGSHCLC